MADYIEPTQSSFNDAENVASDVLSQASPNLITKAGSVVRELIIRPIAYLYSWAEDNLLDKLASTSVMYLKTSQATDNPIADMVASNYFVTRNQGTSAKGIITLTLAQPVLRLAQGSQFTVGGASMLTPEQYLITNGDTSSAAAGFAYIKSIPYKVNGIDCWIANVPVVSAVPGRLELPVGSAVVIGFSTNIIVAAELTSPVTGGTDVETDAQMMARAEYNTAESGIGSYYGLRKKFNKAPVAVLGLSAVAGEDAPLFRARYNNVNINPGGIVDCYVKTEKQPTTDIFPVTFTSAQLVDANNNPVLDENQKPIYFYYGYVDVPCVLSVNSVIIDGERLDREGTKFWTEFESSEPTIPADGARLSSYQRTRIVFCAGDRELETLDGNVSCTYIPGIPALQEFINEDEEHFIGQDTLVKAAVPVEVSVTCSYSAPSMLDDSQIALLKQTIEDYINDIPVGTRTINFSDLRKVCASAVPSADLRLPCVIAGKVFTKSGVTDTFYSNTGIFDIANPTSYDWWDFRECYFSTCADNIRVEAV